MYNFMVNALKSRVIEELKLFFKRHPTYKSLEIFNRFLNLERIQEGIVVKNTTSSRVPLSADNFQGNVYSYVTVAKHSNFPGLSVEWVREDDAHLTTHVLKQDFSNQFTVLPNTINDNVIINLNDFMVKGGVDLSYADNIRDVEVFVNNQKQIPQSVDGKNKIIFLSQPPMGNSKVEVSYWIKNLVAPGVYQITITKEDKDRHIYEFMVDSLLDKEQVLIEQATGLEQGAVLEHHPIYPGSLTLKENGSIMEKDKDYLIDENSGIITFLSTRTTNSDVLTILKNSKVEAFYRVRGLSTGPFNIPNYNYANNVALPGVVLAFGRGISLEDKHFVIVTSERTNTALEYSGKWEMTISLDVYARDSVKIEEIIDLSTSYLNTFIKSELDGEGIALVNTNFSGESEEIFDEGTGDLYYKGSVDYNFLTEWIMHKPLLPTVEGFFIESSADYAENFKPETNKGNFEKIK